MYIYMYIYNSYIHMNLTHIYIYIYNKCIYIYIYIFIYKSSLEGIQYDIIDTSSFTLHAHSVNVFYLQNKNINS